MSRKPKDYTQPDRFTRAAKAAGYPARSVFKLEEIQRRYRIFRQGQRVLDLGAAPGSWTMYVSKEVGPSGRVLAADLSEFPGGVPGNVTVRQLDVMKAGRAELGDLAPYQVVLSDMAPRTSGNKARDQALSFELCQRALLLADELGGADSHIVLKLFMSNDFKALETALRARYAECRTVRPEATRSQSTEVFLVGLRRRAAPAAAGAPEEPPPAGDSR
ncbi:MAG TPA: RlmE family RNA methyltransferase [Polyangiaceae bacterium]|nr:RlmE family RNA methyltransferase [Polyangiaceae bacterium]